tara:strand:- start:1347 stop:1604 length:258 start_codon:yes stop_codon:yes gene_type:complete
MDIRQRLAFNLKRLREERGLSQEQFAFDAGIHRTYISDLERSARNPTIAIVARIAKAFDVFEGDLLLHPANYRGNLRPKKSEPHA